MLGSFEEVAEVAKPEPRLASFVKALGSRVDRFGLAAQTSGTANQLLVVEVFEAINVCLWEVFGLRAFPAILPAVIFDEGATDFAIPHDGNLGKAAVSARSDWGSLLEALAPGGYGQGDAADYNAAQNDEGSDKVVEGCQHDRHQDHAEGGKGEDSGLEHRSNRRSDHSELHLSFFCNHVLIPSGVPDEFDLRIFDAIDGHDF